MNPIEISNLSSREKFQLMEALWEDLRPIIDESEIHEDHVALLESRWNKIASGEDHLVDWDDVKNTIGTPK